MKLWTKTLFWAFQTLMLTICYILNYNHVMIIEAVRRLMRIIISLLLLFLGVVVGPCAVKD